VAAARLAGVQSGSGSVNPGSGSTNVRPKKISKITQQAQKIGWNHISIHIILQQGNNSTSVRCHKCAHCHFPCCESVPEHEWAMQTKHSEDLGYG
jgi:hypothetical protein